MLYVLIFIFGLIIGSFLNACISRIPRGESIAAPPSHCESCNRRLSPLDLIPVFSWLFLQGKCRYCNTQISIKYPLIELLTGVLFVIIFLGAGLSNQFLPSLFLTSLLIIISFIDLEYYLIPNKVIVTGFVLGIVFHIVIPYLPWLDILLGFLVGGGILYLLAIASKGGMGGGDIKLAALIGFYQGLQGVLLSLFIGSFIGGTIGILLILTKIKSRKDPIPFGPFLSIGAITTLFLHSFGFIIY